MIDTSYFSDVSDVSNVSDVKHIIDASDVSDFCYDLSDIIVATQKSAFACFSSVPAPTVQWPNYEGCNVYFLI